MTSNVAICYTWNKHIVAFVAILHKICKFKIIICKSRISKTIYSEIMKQASTATTECIIRTCPAERIEICSLLLQSFNKWPALQTTICTFLVYQTRVMYNNLCFFLFTDRQPRGAECLHNKMHTWKKPMHYYLIKEQYKTLQIEL